MYTRLCVIANGASRMFVSLLVVDCVVDRSVHLVQCVCVVAPVLLMSWKFWCCRKSSILRLAFNQWNLKNLRQKTYAPELISSRVSFVVEFFFLFRSLLFVHQSACHRSKKCRRVPRNRAHSKKEYVVNACTIEELQSYVFSQLTIL